VARFYLQTYDKAYLCQQALKSWKINAIDPRSPHYAPAVFEYEIGIRFNDKERFDVEEYCLSEGWVKVPANKTLDRKGKPLLIKIKGKVEAFYK
jgi:hypothetical protein